MPIWISIIFFIIGLFFLLKGADWLVEGACSLAKRAGVSELIVGLTLVSFGTSLPEFFINIISRFQGNPDITLGDVLGSNIANILLVLGLSAVIHPLSFKRSTVIWEIPFALVVAIILALLAEVGTAPNSIFVGLSRADGLVLLTLFCFFLFYIYRLGKTDVSDKELPVYKHSLPRSLLMVALGLPALALGAKGVVDGAVGIALAAGIQESVIALTIVAVGTSLPELATSIVAMLKKRSDIAVGNIVGSSIFNICWILGVSSLISPLAIPRMYFMDIGIIIAVTTLLFVFVFFVRRGALSRASGIFFVLLYVAYVVSLVIRSQG